MSNTNKNKADLRFENKYLKQQLRSDRLATVMRTLIVYGAWVFMVYFMADAFKALAGKVTWTYIVLEFFGKVSVSQKVSWSMSAGCIVWAIAERTLRRRKTKHLEYRIVKLEKEKDPRRSTSQLTPSGDTNPKDK